MLLLRSWNLCFLNYLVQTRGWVSSFPEEKGMDSAGSSAVCPQFQWPGAVPADEHVKAKSRSSGVWQSQQQMWVAGEQSVTPVVLSASICRAVAASTDGRSVEGKPDGKLGWFICNCLLSFCCVISGMLRKWDNKDMLWEDIMVRQWKMLMKCWKKSFWEWSVHMSIYIAFLMGKVP